MSMSSYHRRILEKSAPDLLNDLDVNDVMPHLVADGVLTKNDVEKIDSKATSREKVTALLDIIPRRGAGAYTSFQNSLLKTEGSTHLYESMKYLEQEVSHETPDDKLQVTQECTDSISRGHTGDAMVLDPTPGLDLLDARQPAHPNRLLKDGDFLELAKGLGEHWQMLAVHLKLSRAEMFHCQENNKFNQQGQTFDMLYKWKCKNGKRATVAALLQACRAVEVLDEEVYEFLYNL